MLPEDLEGKKLDDIINVDSHTYPPTSFYASMDNAASTPDGKCRLIIALSSIFPFYIVVPKTWNITDDLGQIQCIKTGPLTQNIMEFHKCAIHGTAYGKGITEAQRGSAIREGRTQELDPQEMEK